jgi:hypothetical protein
MPTAKNRTADQVTQEVQQAHAEQLNNQLMIPVFGSEMQSEAAFSIRFPLALLLNTLPSPKHGLFIKSESLEQALWNGPEPNHQHRFRKGNKSNELTPGVLLHGFESPEKYPAPRMNMLRVSPVHIEVTEGKDKSGLPPIGLDGRPMFNPETGDPVQAGDIVGVFDPRNPNPLYKCLKDQGRATLRTLFFFFLLDENNMPMHEIPFQLSARGAAAYSLSMAYENWKIAFAKAYSEATGTPFLLTWKEEFYALGVFIPTLGTELAGTEETSEVTAVKDFVRPTKDNFASLFLGTSAQRIASLAAMVAVTEGAATRFFNENEFHRYLPQVEEQQLAALPEGAKELDVDVNPEVDEDGLPLLKSAQPVE